MRVPGRTGGSSAGALCQQMIPVSSPGKKPATNLKGHFDLGVPRGGDAGWQCQVVFLSWGAWWQRTPQPAAGSFVGACCGPLSRGRAAGFQGRVATSSAASSTSQMHHRRVLQLISAFISALRFLLPRARKVNSNVMAQRWPSGAPALCQRAAEGRCWGLSLATQGLSHDYAQGSRTTGMRELQDPVVRLLRAPSVCPSWALKQNAGVGCIVCGAG